MAIGFLYLLLAANANIVRLLQITINQNKLK